MKVSVQLRGKAWKETGTGHLALLFDSPASIFDLFDTLEEKLNWPFKEKLVDPETGDLQTKVIVLVNGLPIRGKLKSITLRDGDKIVLFPHTVCG